MRAAFSKPTVTPEQCRDIIAREPKIVHYPMDDGGVKLAAGWLIDALRLEGQNRGPWRGLAKAGPGAGEPWHGADSVTGGEVADPGQSHSNQRVRAFWHSPGPAGRGVETRRRTAGTFWRPPANHDPAHLWFASALWWVFLHGFPHPHLPKGLVCLSHWPQLRACRCFFRCFGAAHCHRDCQQLPGAVAHHAASGFLAPGAFSFSVHFLGYYSLTVRLIENRRTARHPRHAASAAGLVTWWACWFHEGHFNGWQALGEFNTLVFRIAFASFARLRAGAVAGHSGV